MKKLIYLIILSLFTVVISKAQNPLIIPDTLTGVTINLVLKDSSKQFYTSRNTNTIGYNGGYLGPTIILNKGQYVTMNVHNQLADTTTTYWHGLHVASQNDGSPHNAIMPGNTWSPGFTVLDNAATYWYHPHLHMKTFEQVLKGAAGLIIIRDSIESALPLPRKYGVDDVPLIFQFKTINPLTKQIMLSDSMDNVVMTNGVVNPYLNSPAQVVRYRILNASSARVFRFGFNDNRIFYQIASDDGLLNAPVPLTRLTLGIGERAEILVNLTDDFGKTLFIKTFGNELPSGFTGGPGGMMGGVTGPLDNINFNILQINVTSATTNAVTAIPSVLTSNNIWLKTGVPIRNFTLQAVPVMSTNFFINSTPFKENVNNFSVQKNNVEIWKIQNMTSIAHPFHIHGNHFYIISKSGSTVPINEQGRKDVVLIAPMQTVELITKYETFNDSMMPYMYHCHILKHEDMGMMGQFIVNNSVTGINDMATKTPEIYVYPNPTNDFFFIQNKNTNTVIQQVSISDVLGRNLLHLTNIDFSKIDISNLPTGQYFIQILTNKTITTLKILKQN
ncbi:MAG: multicopper oxidase domain-containing protein [Bacteroidia bacterium]|nr:multicopper oxidase domain-containing protein [Bacteroidia bacterium]